MQYREGRSAFPRAEECLRYFTDGHFFIQQVHTIMSYVKHQRNSGLMVKIPELIHRAQLSRVLLILEAEHFNDRLVKLEDVIDEPIHGALSVAIDAARMDLYVVSTVGKPVIETHALQLLDRIFQDLRLRAVQNTIIRRVKTCPDVKFFK